MAKRGVAASARRTVVIARKEARSILAERTIVLAIVIQFFIAGLSSVLVAGLAALADPTALSAEASPRVALSGMPELATGLRQGGIVVTVVSGEVAAEEVFMSGAVDAALLVTPASNDSEPTRILLLLPDGELRSTIVVAALKGPLETYERQLRAERSSRLSVEPVYLDTPAKSGAYEFVYALLIPLLVLLPALLSGSLVADSMTEELQRRTLPLMLASGATLPEIVGGKILANASLAPILGLSSLALLGLNGFPVSLPDALLIVALSTAAALVTCAMASLAALLLRDRNQTQTFYAGALLLVILASLRLSPSPVNAIARLAAGSAGSEGLGLVAGGVAAALAVLIMLAGVVGFLPRLRDYGA